MKNIYSYESKARTMSGGTTCRTTYFLCESDQEYEDLLREMTDKRKEIVDAFMEVTGGRCAYWPEKETKEEQAFHNFVVYPEQEIHASHQFQHGQGWYGKEFTAIGFEVCLKGDSWLYYYYIKPGTLSKIDNYKEKPNEWMLYCNS